MYFVLTLYLLFQIFFISDGASWDRETLGASETPAPPPILRLLGEFTTLLFILTVHNTWVQLFPFLTENLFFNLKKNPVRPIFLKV